MARGFAASKTKKEFLDKLGLVEGEAKHEEIFRKMLDEATAGRQRISHPACLTAESQNNPRVVPPYTYNQISETARHQEILHIYRSASALTRPYYDVGAYMNGANEENWAVRWCLYHSFRYTDNRNRNRTRTGGTQRAQGASSVEPAPPSDDYYLGPDTPRSDGVEDAHTPQLRRDASSDEQTLRPMDARPKPYYDPARDL